MVRKDFAKMLKRRFKVFSKSFFALVMAATILFGTLFSAYDVPEVQALAPTIWFTAFEYMLGALGYSFGSRGDNDAAASAFGDWLNDASNTAEDISEARQQYQAINGQNKISVATLLGFTSLLKALGIWKDENLSGKVLSDSESGKFSYHGYLSRNLNIDYSVSDLISFAVCFRDISDGKMYVLYYGSAIYPYSSNIFLAKVNGHIAPCRISNGEFVEQPCSFMLFRREGVSYVRDGGGAYHVNTFASNSSLEGPLHLEKECPVFSSVESVYGYDEKYGKLGSLYGTGESLVDSSKTSEKEITEGDYSIVDSTASAVESARSAAEESGETVTAADINAAVSSAISDNLTKISGNTATQNGILQKIYDALMTFSIPTILEITNALHGVFSDFMDFVKTKIADIAADFTVVKPKILEIVNTLALELEAIQAIAALLSENIPQLLPIPFWTAWKALFTDGWSVPVDVVNSVPMDVAVDIPDTIAIADPFVLDYSIFETIAATLAEILTAVKSLSLVVPDTVTIANPFSLGFDLEALLRSIFGLDTALIAERYNVYKAGWLGKLGIRLNPWWEAFGLAALVFDREPPIIKVTTPAIIHDVGYTPNEIVLFNGSDFNDYISIVRNLIRCFIIVTYAYSVMCKFRVHFVV